VERVKKYTDKLLEKCSFALPAAEAVKKLKARETRAQGEFLR